MCHSIFMLYCQQHMWSVLVFKSDKNRKDGSVLCGVLVCLFSQPTCVKPFVVTMTTVLVCLSPSRVTS